MKFGALADSRKTPRAGASLRPPRQKGPRGPQDRASGPIFSRSTIVPAEAATPPQRAARRADSSRSERSRAGVLDTTEQPCQSAHPQTPRQTLTKRARRKYFAGPLAISLAEHAKTLELESGQSLEVAYRRTFYCNAQLAQEGGQLTTKWCGYRWCPTCGARRTAMAITRYEPELRTWSDPQHVTLTLPNVGADALRETLLILLARFPQLARAIRRTDGLSWRAVRKLECTYNPRTDDYHPHFHVVVEGEPQARQLVSRWLDAFPEARPWAQKIKRCDESSLRELFKYFTKLVTKTKGDRAVMVRPLDVIFRAMKGLRVFQPMGFTLPTAAAADEEGELTTDVGTPAIERPAEEVTWTWHQQQTDWIDERTGECLTGYEPGQRYRQLVEPLTPAETNNDEHPRHASHPPSALPDDPGGGWERRHAPSRDSRGARAPNG